MSRFKIRARSVIHPGNHLVEARDGSCYIYFADVAELSATSIDSSLADAMVQSYEWSCPAGTEWVTLEELQSRAPAQTRHATHHEDVHQPGC